jgi:hypothetical protein
MNERGPYAFDREVQIVTKAVASTSVLGLFHYASYYKSKVAVLMNSCGTDCTVAERITKCKGTL